MKPKNWLLYFSLNKESVRQFYDFVKRTNLDRQSSFRVFNKKEVKDFKHASDLVLFLDGQQTGDLERIVVIIDYTSFYSDHWPKQEIDKDCFTVKKASEIICKAILKYPEVLFLFDESWREKDTDDNPDSKKDPDFTDFLFFGNSSAPYINKIIKDYHQYNVVINENPFFFILRERSNLMDGTNLRYAIKRCLYDQLHVNRYNFSLTQNSRADNLALCVEEEYSQNRFNSYALFANGFRVLPVLSSEELKYLDDKTESYDPKFIVRDYDLQFSDVKNDTNASSSVDIEGKQYKINTIDYVRGAKFWEVKENDTGEEYPSGYKNRWYVPNQGDNFYWKNLHKEPTFFVTKGSDHIKLCDSQGELEKERKNLLQKELLDNPGSIKIKRGKEDYKDIINLFKKDLLFKRKALQVLSNKLNNSEKDSQQPLIEWDLSDFPKFIKDIIFSHFFHDKYTIQVLCGISKPVSGIYLPFQSYGLIKERYCQIRITSESDFEEPSDPKGQRWKIETGREHHAHGVPLDIYDIVKNMIGRAQYYYESGNYIRSAIVASEVIEVLNGFHEAMMFRAYHILAVSENAIAMDTIGGSESDLKRDAAFRIEKIECEVDRMMCRGKEKRLELKYNVLNQIYSDCRNFCKEKEHFGAEECFLNAMGHLNEGFTPSDIVDELKIKWNDLKSGFRSLMDDLNNTNADEK